MNCSWIDIANHDIAVFDTDTSRLLRRLDAIIDKLTFSDDSVAVNTSSLTSRRIIQEST